jgi:4-hydroxy-tetrahydrodipicolinate reductase
MMPATTLGSMTRVAVLGAKGRMGSTSVAAIEAAEDLEVVAQVDVGDPLDAITTADAEVALDFTQPDVALGNVRWCIENGVNVVVGTSGFRGDKLDEVRALLADNPSVNVLVVPNFSIGAVLLMRFAVDAAKYFESVEVIEMHHPNKVDAPSGTAVRTAELIAEARAAAGLGPVPDATTTDPDGARGASVAGIPVHAIRARGYVASQEVVFGDAGETFTIRHDSHDRESFMPGVLTALRAVGARPGLTVGLDDLL